MRFRLIAEAEKSAALFRIPMNLPLFLQSLLHEGRVPALIRFSIRRDDR